MLEAVLKGLKRDGYIYLDDFFSDQELKLIRLFTDSQASRFQAASVGLGAQKVIEKTIRADKTLWIDPENPPEALAKSFAFLSSLIPRLNQEFYFGIRSLEAHLALYPKGAFYKKHLDRFSETSSRVCSFIFYLHENWAPGDGGELVLYDKQDQEVITIEPKPGRVALFVSDEFPHEVRETRIERRSLTGWLRNDS